MVDHHELVTGHKYNEKKVPVYIGCFLLLGFVSPSEKQSFFFLFVFGCNFCCMDRGVLFVIMPKQDLLSIDEKFVENCLDKLLKTNEKLLKVCQNVT